MVIGIIYFTVLDGLLGNVPKVRLVWPYTPGGAASAFTSKGHNDNIPTDIHQIAPLAGGLIFLAWAVLLVVLGGNVSLRRDIS